MTPECIELSLSVLLGSQEYLEIRTQAIAHIEARKPNAFRSKIVGS